MSAKSIQPNDRVLRAPGHLQEEIEGQVVLLSVEAGNYYGLDEIGSEIWRALEKETTVAALCETLAAGYDAPAEVVQLDVAAFLDHLARHGLISVK